MFLNDRGHGASVLDVEGGVDLVKEVEGGGVTVLQGQDEHHRHHGLLAPGQLGHVLHHLITFDKHFNTIEIMKIWLKRKY